MEGHGEEDEDGDVLADFSDVISEVVEFELEWGLVIVFHEFSLSFIEGVFSDGEDDHLSGALQDLGSGDEEGVDISVIEVGGDFFGHGVWLSGQGRLVGHDSVGLDDDTINGEDFSGFDEENISDDEVEVGDILDLAISEDVDFSHFGGGLLQFSELFVLHVAVCSSNGDDDDDGNEDGESFEPTLFDTFSDDSEDK